MATAEGDAENDRCTRFLPAVFLVRGPAICVAWPAVAVHAWALLLTRGPTLRLCAAADAARRMALHSFWDELARRLDDSIDEPIRDDKAGGGGGVWTCNGVTCNATLGRMPLHRQLPRPSETAAATAIETAVAATTETTGNW